jgi:dihydrofolate synthase/folylpolyglutamate synthase
VVVLTNVSLDHTEVLGSTREAIAAEKLAVVPPGATVILGEPDWEEAARAKRAAGRVEVLSGSNLGLAVAAAEAFLGRPVDPHAAENVRVPGRLERRAERPLEIWDGAHNLAGVGYLLPRLPARPFTIVASILADKDSDAMLERSECGR